MVATLSLLLLAHGFTPLAFASTNLEENPFTDFETGRLESTGGAGVASILMDESTILNPAPIAFFNMSSIYFQKTGIEHHDSNFSSSSGQTAVIISDGGRRTAGSLSYIGTKRGFNQRKRFALSLSRPMGQRTAMGVTYRYSKEKFSLGPLEPIERGEYKQWIIGLTRILSPSFSLGMVLVDPLKKRKEDSRAMLGFQYVYQDYLSLIFDLGANYHSNFTSSIVYKQAIQLKVLSDFYLRFGTFRDKGLKCRGSGVGLAWVQPRLVFNGSIKNTKWEQRLAKDKKTSFAISYRF